MAIRTRLIASTALTVALFGAGARSQQAPAVNRVALRGATAIDVVAGTTVPEVVIVIEGDKISAVGGRNTPIPAGATIVDLSGSTSFPGCSTRTCTTSRFSASSISTSA